jgi:hypothetical protein
MLAAQTASRCDLSRLTRRVGHLQAVQMGVHLLLHNVSIIHLLLHTSTAGLVVAPHCSAYQSCVYSTAVSLQCLHAVSLRACSAVITFTCKGQRDCSVQGKILAKYGCTYRETRSSSSCRCRAALSFRLAASSAPCSATFLLKSVCACFILLCTSRSFAACLYNLQGAISWSNVCCCLLAVLRLRLKVCPNFAWVHVSVNVSSPYV